MRLFVGIDLPPPIVELLEALPRPDVPHLRWTTPEQWHVTLRFLGEVDRTSEVVDAVHAAVDDIGSGAIEAALGPVTRWFPARTVLYVPVAGLESLADPVRRSTARWAADTGQGFTGHVTLARVGGRAPGPAELAGIPIACRFTVTELAVFASSLEAGGATYEVIERIPIARDQTGV